MPETVADLDARSVASSTDAPDASSWAAAWGDPAVVLRCGVPRPAGFTRTSRCTTVEAIDWYLPEDQLEPDADGDVVLTTVNRSPRVEVRLPREHWPPATAMVDLAPALKEHSSATGRCV